MTRYNPKYLLPNARTNTGTSFGTRGNSAVSSWKPGNRIFETKNYWNLKVLHPDITDIGFYETGGGLHMFASSGTTDNKYITSPSYGSATDSWTLRNLGVTGTAITGLIFWNSVWYMCTYAASGGIGGSIYSSTDGITWTARASLSYGGFFSIGARYNYGLSRNEVAAVGMSMGTIYNYASINNGAFSGTAGGGNSAVSSTFAEFNSGNVFGAQNGNLYQAYYSGGAAFTAATTPIGSSAISAIARAPYGYSSYYYIANTAGSLAVCADSIGSTWTLINSPLAGNSGGEYITDIHYKNDGQFRNLLMVVTNQGRMFAGPSNAALYTPWTEISPVALTATSNSDLYPPIYRFMNRFTSSINNQLGVRAGAISTSYLYAMNNFSTTASRGITYTDSY